MKVLTIIGLSLCVAVLSQGDSADTNKEEAAGAQKEEAEVPRYEPEHAVFYERFDDMEQWKHSSNEDSDAGHFVIGSGPEPSLPGDTGLLVPEGARKYAVSAKFGEGGILGVEDADFVVQYEVRLHERLQCGGAYLKLIRQTEKEFVPAEFSSNTPFSVMFGPDHCGATDKVHFIFNYLNPKSGKYVEHHLQTPVQIVNDKKTHLYTLAVFKNDTFEISIDLESKVTGSLLVDFSPPVNPPKEIDDPEDSKPEDWVDEARIADPEATKPEDWDEDAPEMIPDEEASQPEDWLEDEEYEIDDPEAVIPEDWDTEMDGDFEAPVIANPKCKAVSGCGVWKRPEIANPEYKGKWSPPLIDNPAYKGEWSPRQIPNPDWFETDKVATNLSPMVGVGIEIWTMQKSIEFDNIYVSNDVESAKEFAQHTFVPKQKFEEEAMKPEERVQDKISAFFDQFSGGEYAEMVIDFVKENYIAVISASILGFVSLIYLMCCFGAAPARAPPARSPPRASSRSPRSQAPTSSSSDAPSDLPEATTENKQAQKATTQSSSSEAGDDRSTPVATSSSVDDGEAGQSDELLNDDTEDEDLLKSATSTGLAQEEENEQQVTPQVATLRRKGARKSRRAD